MDIKNATVMFDALSQETRLQATRLLVEAGPAGLAAGAISDALETPHNTLSFHLNQLANAGIVSSSRAGRSVIYTVNFDAMQALIAFMASNCCGGGSASFRTDARRGKSIIEFSTPCCPTTKSESSRR